MENAHIHIHKYWGGVARILVSDNCKTAVIHNSGFKDRQINEIYQEMTEHYGTAIIPAHIRALRYIERSKPMKLHSIYWA